MAPDDKPPMPKIDETKPVIWTPEDASRFLTSAIHEAQRPLAEALKQRPITARALTVMISLIIVAALIISLILSNQLEKAEKRAELNQAARDALLAERHEISAKAMTLEDRLNSAIDEQGVLAATIDSLRGNEEALRKTQNDLARFRRQTELLRSQISGLEMEKAAIHRQLEAIKALAMDETGGEGLADDATPFDGTSSDMITDGPVISTPVTDFDAEAGVFIAPRTMPEPAVTDSPAPLRPPVQPSEPVGPVDPVQPETTPEMLDEAVQPVEPVSAVSDENGAAPEVPETLATETLVTEEGTTPSPEAAPEQVEAVETPVIPDDVVDAPEEGTDEADLDGTPDSTEETAKVLDDAASEDGLDNSPVNETVEEIQVEALPVGEGEIMLTDEDVTTVSETEADEEFPDDFTATAVQYGESLADTDAVPAEEISVESVTADLEAVNGVVVDDVVSGSGVELLEDTAPGIDVPVIP